MKATSIFGGVQVFNIIISIIRSKFIAILLGPTGMGIAGLLLSTLGLIGSITNFGLGTSAVRNVSFAASTGDTKQIRTTVTIVRRLFWITGLLGTVLTIILSPYLSELTFGNRDYTFAFVFIAVTLLLSQLSSGQLVILQGLRKLKYLAKADMAGMLVALFVSIPLYYKFGVKGIVPAIIISSFLTLFFSWYFASKVKITKINVGSTIFKSESKAMLTMGFMLGLSGIITVAASYIIKIFIGRTGGLDQVGLYSAGFAIINTYVGMIFTAMTTDYYPRLSEVSSDNIETKNVINSQAEIAILILAPILIGFLTFVDLAVIILYSSKFSGVNGMLHWAALGMFFKTVSWAIGFVFLAKGASKLFFWNELGGNIYILLLNILGYYFYGLNGLGLSFLIGYILFFFQVFLVAKKYYNFKIEKAIYKIFILQFLLGLLCFILVKISSTPYSYLYGILLLILSGSYSYFELDKRLDIRTMLNNLMRKK